MNNARRAAAIWTGRPGQPIAAVTGMPPWAPADLALLGWVDRLDYLASKRQGTAIYEHTFPARPPAMFDPVSGLIIIAGHNDLFTITEAGIDQSPPTVGRYIIPTGPPQQVQEEDR